MITIPLKGMIDSDWISPLRQYIASIYGPGDHFKEEAGQIHRLRQDVRGSAADTIGRDLVYRYYRQLQLLELRIPVNEHSCRVSFSWLDAFTHEPTTQYSLAFEKASLLYNFAAINCHIAADTEDIKLAYNSLQTAAGTFNFIMENFLHAPSTDLSQENVKALSKLMLAQGQECFLDKLLQDGTGKPAMIAKLAKGASNFYKTAAESLQAVHTSKLWGEKAWHQYCFIKAKYFLAVSYDYQSKVHENNGKYGDAISYLTQSINYMQEAAKMPIPTQYSEISKLFKGYVDSARHRLSAIEKDNDFIYHTLVPPISTLTEVPALEAAKPTEIDELYKDSNDITQVIGKEIFENLIPLSIHEKSSMYSEEKAELLRKEGEKVEIADEELSSALEFLDLPGSLKLVKQDSDSEYDDLDVPSIIKNWASEVNAFGNETTFSSVEDARSEVFRKVKASEKKLTNEEDETEQMKKQYGPKLNQVSSLQMSSGIQGDIQSIKQSLNSGANSDAKVKQMLDGVQNDIDTLRKGPNSPELEHVFQSIKNEGNDSANNNSQSLLDLDFSPSNTSDGVGDVNQLIDKAEELLNKLSKVSKERKTSFMEFKDKVHKDDISSVLILNSKVPNIEEKVFKSELEKFRPYEDRLESTIHHQQNMLKELQTTWKQVLANESVKKRTSTREGMRAQRAALIERFRKAYNVWKDAQEGLTKGKEFYSELDAFAVSVSENVNQFVQNRVEERQKLIAETDQSQQQQRSGSNPLNQESLRQQLADMSLSYQQTPPPQQQGGSPWGDLSALENKPPSLPPKPPGPGQQPPPQNYQQYSTPPPQLQNYQQHTPPPPQQQSYQQPPPPPPPGGFQYSFQQQPQQNTPPPPQQQQHPPQWGGGYRYY